MQSECQLKNSEYDRNFWYKVEKEENFFMLGSSKKSCSTILFFLIMIFIVSFSMGVFIYKAYKDMRKVEIQKTEQARDDFEILSGERM